MISDSTTYTRVSFCFSLTAFARLTVSLLPVTLVLYLGVYSTAAVVGVAAAEEISLSIELPPPSKVVDLIFAICAAVVAIMTADADFPMDSVITAAVPLSGSYLFCAAAETVMDLAASK